MQLILVKTRQLNFSEIITKKVSKEKMKWNSIWNVQKV